VNVDSLGDPRLYGNHDGVPYVHVRAYKSAKALLFYVRGPQYAGENRCVLV
jgi:hypothetical protein